MCIYIYKICIFNSVFQHNSHTCVTFWKITNAAVGPYINTFSCMYPLIFLPQDLEKRGNSLYRKLLKSK